MKEIEPLFNSRDEGHARIDAAPIPTTPERGVDPLFDSRWLARSMYRAGYLSGWEERDAGRQPRPDLTDAQIDTMLAALDQLGIAPRPDRISEPIYRHMLDHRPITDG